MVSMDGGNTNYEAIITPCEKASREDSWYGKAFVEPNTTTGRSKGQDKADQKTSAIFVKFTEDKFRRDQGWYEPKQISLIDERPMTAVTVDFYVGGALADQIYLDHDQVISGTLDGLIEEARQTSITGKDKDGTLPSVLVSVYISWHEHDVCEDPTLCKGEQPVVPTYEFIQGLDPETARRQGYNPAISQMDPQGIYQDEFQQPLVQVDKSGSLIDGNHRLDALNRIHTDTYAKDKYLGRLPKKDKEKIAKLIENWKPRAS